MSLIATLENAKFTPFVQYFIVSHKDANGEVITSRVKTEDEAQVLVNSIASDAGTQYVVLKTMWQTDAEGNRLLKEYVASRRNGGLANGQAIWKPQSVKSLPPYDFSKSDDSAPQAESHSPFSM